MLTLGDLMWPCYWKNTPLAKSWLTAGSGFGLPLCPPPPSPAPEKKWGFSTVQLRPGRHPAWFLHFGGTGCSTLGLPRGGRNPPSTVQEGTQHKAEHEKGNGMAAPFTLASNPAGESWFRAWVTVTEGCHRPPEMLHGVCFKLK